MLPLHADALTTEELSEWEDVGFIRLGHVAPESEIAGLKDRIDEIMLGETTYDDMLMQLCPSSGMELAGEQSKSFKGATLKYRKIQDLEMDPLFLEYIQKPLFRDITNKIIANAVSVYRAMFFNKPAGEGVTINWHQDGAGGWNLSIPPKVTIWTALDRTTLANGCLQLVAGTHREIIPETGDLLSDEQIAIHAPDSKRQYIEMEAGEVVLLHNWALHRSETNSTDGPRRGFSVCYIDAETTERSSGRGFPQVFPDYIPVASKAATQSQNLQTPKIARW